VVKLDSNLNVMGLWAPGNWANLDTNDTDLGSSMPVLLPDGLVFEIGKQGVGYLLSASNLTGEGGKPVYSRSVCGGSWGGGIYVSGVIYVTCSNGLHALALNTTSNPPSFAPLAGWTVNSGAIASPIFAGGLVWAGGSSLGTNNGTIYGLDPKTGKATFSANLGGLEDFGTAGAGGGRLFVPNQDQTVSGVDQITAFQISTTPPPTPTSVAVTASENPAPLSTRVTYTATVSPGPDAGSITFYIDGALVPNCMNISLNPATSHASCTFPAFPLDGANTQTIKAVYSGDQYYLGSSGSLTETVGPSQEPVLRDVHVRVVHRKLRLRLAQSQPGTLAIAMFKLEPGRLVFGRCRAGAKHGRRCRALRHRGTLHVFLQAGQHRLRPHMRRLPAGRYAITLSAVGLNGERSNAVTVIVTVKRRAGARPLARIAVQMGLRGLSLF
jgi:hypothetical protein